MRPQPAGSSFRATAAICTGAQWRAAGYFPPATLAFASRIKIAALAILRWRFGRAQKARGAEPVQPAARLLPRRPAKGAGALKDKIMTDDMDIPAQDATSATGQLLEEMQLYGYRPFEDEPDPRPLPEPRLASAAVADMFDGLIASLQETRIEPDLDGLLWNLVNLFHRAGERIERELDRNEQTQKALQHEQDGSEIRSVELERAIAEGISMIERRDTMEFFREAAAYQYRTHMRKAWSPSSGSRLNHRAMTSAVIDSRQFLDVRLRDKAALLIPAGTRIGFAGGASCSDHKAIWNVLDRLLARHPDMILLHGATPLGAERAAACWADTRNVVQVAFRPDWSLHAKAAPFKRNDRMLEALPIGLVLFPGNGIQDNLADKARKMGIPLWDFRHR
jgi:hypothetical protein